MGNKYSWKLFEVLGGTREQLDGKWDLSRLSIQIIKIPHLIIQRKNADNLDVDIYI